MYYYPFAARPWLYRMHTAFRSSQRMFYYCNRCLLALQVSLEQLYAQSDFITLHVPLNNDTRNLISKATLAKCKKGELGSSAAKCSLWILLIRSRAKYDER